MLYFPINDPRDEHLPGVPPETPVWLSMVVACRRSDIVTGNVQLYLSTATHL